MGHSLYLGGREGVPFQPEFRLIPLLRHDDQDAACAAVGARAAITTTSATM